MGGLICSTPLPMIETSGTHAARTDQRNQMSTKNLRRAIIGMACGASAVLAMPAFAAAATLSLSTSADPAEDRPITLRADVTAAAPDTELFVTLKPSGGVGCGASWSQDTGSNQMTYRGVEGSTSEIEATTFDNPGTYLMCGWLQKNGNDLAPSAVAQATVTVRSANASLTLSAPQRVKPATPFVVRLSGTAEVQRDAYITMKRAGGAGCGSSFSTDTGTNLVYGSGVEGVFDQAKDTTIDAPGTYLLCGWIAENANDLAPEAAAQVTVTVPDVAGCNAAKLRATTATRSRSRHLAKAKTLDRRASKAHGARRKRLRRQAKAERALAAKAAGQAATAAAAVKTACA
jgi:hypothetical protein